MKEIGTGYAVSGVLIASVIIPVDILLASLQEEHEQARALRLVGPQAKLLLTTLCFFLAAHTAHKNYNRGDAFLFRFAAWFALSVALFLPGHFRDFLLYWQG